MRKLVVAGDPIGYSLSPLMHNAALKAVGLNDTYHYSKLQLKKNQAKNLIDQLHSGEIFGANLTQPIKQSLLIYLDELSPEAKIIGAVNTIYRKDNKLIGANTDAKGFLNAIYMKIDDVDSKSILVLGAGGAAYAICFSLLSCNAIVKVKNRSIIRETQLINFLKPLGNISGFKDKDLKNFDILINCTSIGSDNKSLPINSYMLHPDLIVVDIIYNPLFTPLLIEASKIGCQIVDGVGMFVEQGAISYKLFTGEKPNKKVMKNSVYNFLQSH